MCPSTSRSLAARFLVFLLWVAKMSDLFFEGRGRPRCWVVEEVERRLERVDVKARLVEEEISLGVYLGLRIP